MIRRPDVEGHLDTKELVEELLAVSRALVGMASRSLDACEDEVTLAQYRALVVLCVEGAVRMAELATALDITPPNASRICDRLAQKGLVRRTRSPRDRRTVRVSVTTRGRDTVTEVSSARRVELGRIVQQMTLAGQEHLIDGLRAFSTAAGTASERESALGWGQ